MNAPSITSRSRRTLLRPAAILLAMAAALLPGGRDAQSHADAGALPLATVLPHAMHAAMQDNRTDTPTPPAGEPVKDAKPETPKPEARKPGDATATGTKPEETRPGKGSPDRKDPEGKDSEGKNSEGKNSEGTDSTDPPAKSRASTPTTGANPPANPPPGNSPPATPAGPASANAGDIGPIYAVFRSMSGEIRVRLHVDEAPRTCANFINLAQRGYYIRKQWNDFSPVVRQLGTPLAPDQIPYSIPLEFSAKQMFDVGGRLCLANTSDEPGARGHPCRIFLTIKPQDRWNLVYVIFGTVKDGLDVAQRLVEGELIEEVRIESERPGDLELFLGKHRKNIAKWNAALDKRPLP